MSASCNVPVFLDCVFTAAFGVPFLRQGSPRGVYLASPLLALIRCTCPGVSPCPWLLRLPIFDCPLSRRPPPPEAVFGDLSDGDVVSVHSIREVVKVFEWLLQGLAFW